MHWLKAQELYVPAANIDAPLVNFPTLIYLDNHPIFDVLDDDSMRFNHGIEINHVPLTEELIWWNSAQRKAVIAVGMTHAPTADTRFLLGYDDANEPNPLVFDRGGAPSIWQDNATTWFPCGDPSGPPPQLIDSSGNFPGTANGIMTSGDLVDGPIGLATEFDGTNDYYDCGTPPSVSVMWASVTAFFRPGGPQPGGRIVARSATGNLGFELVRNANRQIEFGVSSNGSAWLLLVTANDFAPDTEWSYIKVTADGSFIRIYKNGIEQTTGNFPYPYSSLISMTGQPLWLASNPQFPDTFGGAISYGSLAVKAHSAAWTRAEYLGLTGQFVKFGEFAVDHIKRYTGINYLADTRYRRITTGTTNATVDRVTGINRLRDDQMSRITSNNSLSSSKRLTIHNELAYGKWQRLTGKNRLEKHDGERYKRITALNISQFSNRITGGNELTQSRRNRITGKNIIGYRESYTKRYTTINTASVINRTTGKNELSGSRIKRITAGNILFGNGNYNRITGKNNLTEPTENYKRYSTLNRLTGQSFSIITDPDTDPIITGNVITSVDSQVYIDDIEVSMWYTEFRISQKRTNSHNEIVIRGIGSRIFEISDPESKPRIRVVIGTREREFQIEERTGDNERCEIHGYSLSILDDQPDTIEYNIIIDETNQKMASVLAAELLEYNPLTWSAHDYILPIGFQVDGRPFDILIRLAKTVDAIIRPSDGLGITVERRLPVRPVYMQNKLPAIEYDDMSIYRGDSTQTITGDRFDSVEIIGASASIELPEIEVEPMPDGQQRLIGIDSYIRVWPRAGADIDILSGFATDGKIQYIGKVTEKQTQIVTFKRTVGSVSYPITKLKSAEWIGNDGGNIQYEKGGKDLVIGNQHGIAEVTYTTTFHRYSLRGHDVTQLLAGLFVNPSENAAAIIAHGRDNPAPAITDTALPDLATMIERGKAELDKSYDKIVHSFRSPYRGSLNDGLITGINDSKIGSRGNYLVVGAETVSIGAKLTQTIEVEQCVIKK